MHTRVGRFLTSLLIILSILIGSAPAAGGVAAADPAPPSKPDATRDGDLSPSLLLPQAEVRLFLPSAFFGWPPRPAAPVLTGPGMTLSVLSDYTLIWSLPTSSISATLYLVEESEVPDFSESTTHTTTSTSKAFHDKVGHFYYRVRGFNFGVPGPWSNVVTVSATAFNDPFAREIVPWDMRRTSSDDPSKMTFTYVDGGLAETMVKDRFDFAIFSPMVPAPEVPYVIRMSSKIVFRVNLVSYGIVWGAPKGDFCDITLKDAANQNGCFSHYYRLNAVYGGTYWQYNIKRIDYHEGVGGSGEGVTLVDWVNLSKEGWDPDDWHLWEVHVYSDHFDVYLNGDYRHTVQTDTYARDPYYGIFSSANEYNQAQFLHDYFVVTPIE